MFGFDVRISTGSFFDRTIQKELDIAKCVIVLWSRQSTQSQWVKEEAYYAAKLGKLFPVKIQDIEIPFGFSQFHTYSLVNWKHSPTDSIFLRLLSDLSKILGDSPESVRFKNQHNKQFKSRNLDQDTASYSKIVFTVLCLGVISIIMFWAIKKNEIALDLSLLGPDSLEVNQLGTFTAIINNDASKPVQYEWNMGDSILGHNKSFTLSFDQPGNYHIGLSASNKKGNAKNEKHFFVYQRPISAKVTSISSTPKKPNTRTRIKFSAEVLGDLPINYSWSFGDMGNSTKADPEYTFKQPGTYTVTLLVGNSAGSDTHSMQIVVDEYVITNTVINNNVRQRDADYCSTELGASAAYFAKNSSALIPEARAALQENFKILEDCPSLSIIFKLGSSSDERNVQSLVEDREIAIKTFYANNGLVDRIIVLPTVGGKSSASVIR